MKFQTFYIYQLPSKGVSREFTKDFDTLQEAEIWLSTRNGIAKVIYAIWTIYVL